ncbi:MAG: hypothetical protein EON60_11515 [Alphaproteobacteria bacterium]|nr:MAG: hypothetical protein EON60_11515 [Alphaproteobacteria bacterium]
MTMMPAKKNQAVEEQAFTGAMTAADMLTVKISLHQPGHELMLAMPRAEWLKLVSDFVRMPADERQRMGVSIRDAVAESPFPAEADAMTPKLQRKCDVFVNDCILVAALAEALGSTRVLLDTAVDRYAVVNGLPDLGHVRGAFH